MKVLHTPGPWHAWNKGGDGIDPYTWEVAGPMHSVENHVVIADKLTEENARLIAAAPELLIAAKSALAKLEKLIPDWEQVELRNVVAKAEGKDK